MDEKREAFVPVAIVLFLFLCLVFGVVFLDYKYTVNITQANIVKVYQDQKLLFKGKLAFVDVKSGGMTTTVVIYQQLFPFHVVKEVYSNSNLRIENQEKE